MSAQSQYSARHAGQRLGALTNDSDEFQYELDDQPMLSDIDQAGGYGHGVFRDRVPPPAARTRTLINEGRHGSYRRQVSRNRRIIPGVVIVATFIAVVATMLSGGEASWPSSVATVQGEIAKACQNPDVKSEPGQVDFACDQATRQVLWVFSLMTSNDDPSFSDAHTGREGLEPIAPAQGGQLAWSLNLHSPYDPLNPIDSLEIAARAINSIIGGASMTNAKGEPVVQPGLEGNAANCLRYTGSAALEFRAGFPSVCVNPVTSTAGQGALVADIYRRWIVGASPTAVQDAAILFENANNPGDPQVQAILKQLPGSGPAA